MSDPLAEFLDRQQAASLLRVSTRTLDRLDVPKVKLGARRVIYRRADLVRFVEARAAKSAA